MPTNMDIGHMQYGATGGSGATNENNDGDGENNAICTLMPPNYEECCPNSSPLLKFLSNNCPLTNPQESLPKILVFSHFAQYDLHDDENFMPFNGHCYYFSVIKKEKRKIKESIKMKEVLTLK